VLQVDSIAEMLESNLILYDGWTVRWLDCYAQFDNPTIWQSNHLTIFIMFSFLKKEAVPPVSPSTTETPFTTTRLDSLMNIDAAFQKTRLISIIALVASFVFAIIVMVIAMSMVTKGKGKIYVTDQGSSP